MSLLGLDVGTTGCKSAIYSEEGKLLSSSYVEYHTQRRYEGWAELDAIAVWEMIKNCIRACVQSTKANPVTAISVSSLGEAFVPISKNREILSTSILNFDSRGEEFIEYLHNKIQDEVLYRINGNTLGNHYSLTKILWIKEHQPELYRSIDKILHWSGFVCTMLGADPAVDYSLANRSLLFDINSQTWSEPLLDLFHIDPEKLPQAYPSGTLIGQVDPVIANELGLSPKARIFTGAHDQCANSIGCGAIQEGQAMYGMGTFFCVTPVFQKRRSIERMMQIGLNTEHHACPGRFVSFIYNQGGSLLKWYRDTFAVADKTLLKHNEDIYDLLIAEIPKEPGKIVVLPHFTVTGPPNFISNSAGVISGLHLETSRGEILKGIMENVVFYLYGMINSLQDIDIHLSTLRAVGGGSKSDAWVQITSDITGLPLERPVNLEAGALGAAMIAGVGSGIYNSYEECCSEVVKIDKVYTPDHSKHEQYMHRYEKYQKLYPLLQEYLTE